MRATILGWSTASGLVLGLIAGLLAFSLIVVAGELAPGFIPRMSARIRGIAAVLAFVIVPVIGATFGWLEGRLKLQ
jgi:hypothetical protein